MLLTAPQSFDAAVRRLESKTPVAMPLSTAQLQQLGVGVLDRAFFSARVDDIRIVAEMQSRIRDALTLTRRDGGAFMDRSRFIADMRAYLGAGPGDSGQLTDITSARRLGLIYDFNVTDAYEYGRWLARQDPAILDAFPCSELVRIESRIVPRGWRKGAGGRLVEVPNESWPARWAAAGGEFFGGRMIAPKDSKIWIAISRFGRPWPPFDFESGMGLADVSRRDSEAMGVIEKNAPAPAPQDLDFNHNLQASVPDATPSVLEGFKDIFGDQVDVAKDGKITWQGQRVLALYEKALADRTLQFPVDLGVASPRAITLADQVGVDLGGARLIMTADDVRHIEKSHGAGSEQQGDQRPIGTLELQLLPHVWREPDSISAGSRPGSLEFRREILGQMVLIAFDRAAKSPKWSARTLYIKKKGTP